MLTSPATIFYLLLGVSCIVRYADCTPTGAPTEACTSMTPNHLTYTPQTSPSPFVNIPTLMEDETVRLTLLANSTGYSSFRGYLVMAFDTKNLNQPIGMFNQTAQGTPVLTSGNYLNCLDGQQNAATHKQNDDKYVVNLLWIPPEGFVGNVTFKTTFVKNVSHFWVTTPSDDIFVSSPVEITKITTTESTTTESTTTESTTSVPDSAAISNPWIGTLVLAMIAYMVAPSA